AGVGFDSSGRLHVAVGLGGNVESRALLGLETLGTLLRIPVSGDPIVVSDLVAYEQENDPVVGSHGPDSNPFGLAFDGMDALVVDAGANALLRVKSDGTTSTEAVFPVQFVDPPSFLGLPSPFPMEAVPTGITITDGGRVLVGNLTGFPFMPGHARVVAVVAGNLIAEEAGFTNIIDIAAAPDGSLYVLEFASNSLLSPDGPQAALTQVRPDGTRKVLLYGDQLPVPGGVTVADDGMVYVSACTLCGPGQGMVWKIDPTVAGDPATASACDPAAVPGTSFTDTKSSTHREAIDCVAHWGIMNGFSASSFGPTAQLTREQAASVILRTITAADVAIIQGAPDAFTDDDGSPHEMDINTLAAMGVIEGRADGTFDPKANVSRAELASLMVRAYAVVAGEALAAGSDAFTDDNGSGHEAAINAAAAAGWLKGVGGAKFHPEGAATRAQVASVVARMLSTLVDKGLASPA
ncbi:MAG: ScyD/ScyE family protein, partial [Acidimicrobiia bacterium]|nr:ScyD/ScyE family protein [Acidimicrobiia bacterium]